LAAAHSGLTSRVLDVTQTGPAYRTLNGRSGIRTASSTTTVGLVLAGQLDRLAAVVGQAEHIQVVLGGKEHPKPLGDQHMLIGEQERHDIAHESLGDSA
jgi:hypothetical protein